MPGQDSNTKLLLHLDGLDGATSTTDATGRHGTINFYATAQLDTAEKKWGTASLLLDGDSDYLSIPDSADWDVFASNSDDWTIDFWLRRPVVNTEVVYITHYVDTTHRWYFRSEGNANIQMYVYNGGVFPITVSTLGGMLSANTWHHIAFVKKANEYGIYVDGVQKAYTSDNDTINFAGLLIIGQLGNGSGYFNGHMDEIRIQKSNYFNAAPNVGVTNTINVPIGPYSESSIRRNRAVIIC